MNWLERYTFAVKAYLPQKLKDDVANELLSDLQDECEDREETLGRALTDDEVKALLRERGHPMVVAAFQPRKALVSESLFPLYVVILKWLIIGIALMQAIIAVISIIQQTEPSYTGAVMQLLWGTFNTSLYAFAWLTLVFFLFGESSHWTDSLKNWQPESLPEITAQDGHISQTGSTIELILYLFVLAWLNQLIRGQWSAEHLILSDQWATLLPWINLSLAVMIAFTATKLLKPYWTKAKLLIECSLHLPAIVILAIIASWDGAITLMIGEPPHPFIVPSQWLQFGLLGYLIAAAVDVVQNLRIYGRL